MIRKVLALFVGVALSLGLAACSQRVYGEVISKEHESRNCEKYKKGKCAKWDPEEWELTIRQDNGQEVELVVAKETFNSAAIGTRGTWKGVID